MWRTAVLHLTSKESNHFKYGGKFMPAEYDVFFSQPQMMHSFITKVN